MFDTPFIVPVVLFISIASVLVLRGPLGKAIADRIAKLSYQSGRGTLALALADLDLAGLPPGEAHLGVELTIGTRTYYTAVTFFEGRSGRWSTTMPGR